MNMSNPSGRTGPIQVVLFDPRTLAGRAYLPELGLLEADGRAQLVAAIDIEAASSLDRLGEVLVFRDITALAPFGIRADLLLVAGPAPAWVIRYALEQGWQVVGDELLTDDPSEQEALLALARERGLSLLAGGSLDAFAGLPLMTEHPSSSPLGDVRSAAASWSRSAGPGTAYEGQTSAAKSLLELLPRTLLSILLQVEGGVPVRVRVTLEDGPRPVARAAVELVDGTVVSVVVDHDPSRVDGDRSRIVLSGATDRTVSLDDILSSVYASQLEAGLRTVRAHVPAPEAAGQDPESRLLADLRDMFGVMTPAGASDRGHIQAVAAVMVAARTSLVNGAWVAVELPAHD